MADDPDATLKGLKARLGLAAALSTRWRAARPGVDPGRVAFLDEAWAAANMTRPRGRSPRGERVSSATPHGHWKTTPFAAALRSDRLTAPMVIDGAMTGDLFAAYVRQVRVPELRPGDVVVVGGLRCHQRADAARAIAAAGVRFLPPYSPDLNPIENAFSELTGMLRAAGRRAAEGLWSFRGEARDAFAPTEWNDLRRCGYAATPTSEPL